jgi:hypothetical protein
MRVPPTLAAAVFVVLLLGACGAGKDSAAGPNPTVPPPAPASSYSVGTAPPANPATTTVDGQTGKPTPADPSQSMNTDLGQPVATRSSSSDGVPVTLTMYPVVRSGTTSSVNFTLSSTGEEGGKLQVADMLSDGDYESSDFSGHAADGLSLVDTKNSKLYLVASDGKGTCLCSRQLAGVFLSENLPVVFSATFGAPPSDVTTVDVRIPTFGTVRNVPVQ